MNKDWRNSAIKAIFWSGLVFLVSAAVASITKKAEYFEYATWYLTMLVLLVTLLSNEKTSDDLSTRLDNILEELRKIRASMEEEVREHGAKNEKR